MRIGLAGTGRIGAFHASTLAALDAVDEVVVTDALPGHGAAAGERARLPLRAGPRRRCSGRSTRLVIATSTDAHAATLRRAVQAGVTDVLREAGRPHPGGDHRAARPGRGQRRAGARRLPAPVRRGLPARPGRGAQRRARLRPHRAGAHPRPVAAPGRLHPHQRRALPGLQHPRLRHPPVRHRPRGGQRLRGSAPTRATPSSPRAATSTPPPRCSRLDDDTLVSVSATRYNGAGHDVRMEVHGSQGTVGVGYDESLARPFDGAGRGLPAGPAEVVVHGALPAGVPRGAHRVHRGRRRRAEPVHRGRRAGRLPDRGGVRAVPAQGRAGGRRAGRRCAGDGLRPGRRSDAPASTSTRSSTASGWRTSGPSRSSSAAARPTSRWRRRSTAATSPLVTRTGQRPVRSLRPARGRAARRRPGVHLGRRRAAHAGHLLRGVPARRLPAVLLPLPDRAGPAADPGRPADRGHPSRRRSSGSP